MEFGSDDIETLKSLEVVGPFPFFNGKVFVPKPLDCLVDESERKLYAVRPAKLRDNEGTNLPDGLLPVMLPDSKEGEFKPAKTAPFWSLDKMIDWLAQPTICGEDYKEKDNDLNALEQEERTHVAIEPKTGAAKDSMLFSTTGLDFEKENGKNVEMIAEVAVSERLIDTMKTLNTLHPLGGERRLVHWKTDSMPLLEVPKSLSELSDIQLVRMVLTTPAIFANGWCPSWINGTVPGTDVKLKLIGAAVERWRPISGWSYENNQPKAVRRLVPAGSVYFFQIEQGDFGQLLDNVWMRSVCDDEQDRRDGFGLALWGVWNYNE